MKKAFYKKLLQRIPIVFMAIIVTGYLFAGYFPWLYKQFDHEPLWVSHSPDQRFSVASYAIPFLPFRLNYFRGIGCMDCPGYIRLIDNRSGELLQEEYFRMQGSLTNKVDWNEERVWIEVFARWPLPER